MGRRQQRQRQFGLGADGVEAGGVDHHQPALQQGVRVVDQRMAPGGHLDRAVGFQPGVVLGVIGVPEAQPLGGLDRHALCQGHGRQRLRQLIGAVGVERDALPGLVAAAQFGHGQAAQAGLDRQQRQSRGLVGLVVELDRAHRGAARRGRQHTPAGVGEEDGVDQLGLAARELGHEGHGQAIGLQALVQGLQACAVGRVLEVVIAQEPRKSTDAAVECGAPDGLAVQAGGEGAVHGQRHPSAASRGATAAKHLLTRPLRRNAQGVTTGGRTSARAAHRRWHPGHQYVARWPCTPRRIGVAQRRHGRPARP